MDPINEAGVRPSGIALQASGTPPGTLMSPKFSNSNRAGATQLSRSATDAGILLVEDSADDAELSLRVLSKAGIAAKTKWVHDGTDAMEWLQEGGQQSVRLILLDIKMPRMDGFEVLRRLKRQSTTDDIPVVVMVSAHGTPELAQCFELGADSYLLKPLEAEALLQVIRSLDVRLE